MSIDHPRVALEPLLDYVNPHSRPSIREIAELLHCSRASVRRWRVDGIPIYTADRLAVAAGAVPWEIWGREFDVGIVPDVDVPEQGVML